MPSASIFVGYRRRDSQGFAGRVADDLIERFGAARVFRDDDIPEGSDFTAVLDGALAACDVLIVVIGPRWVHARDADGRARLHDPEDWVRREIETALRRDVWVLPVLVGGASMPTADELPPTLAPLVRVQGVEMSDRRWEEDLERLTGLLIRRVPALGSTSPHARRPTHASDPRGASGAFGAFGASGASGASGAYRGEPAGRVSAGRGVPAKVPARRRGAATSRMLGALRRGAVAVARRLGAAVPRLLRLGALALVGWFLLENYATPEIRDGAYEFVAFVREKLASLVERVDAVLGERFGQPRDGA